jgi:hypothetical protein
MRANDVIPFIRGWYSYTARPAIAADSAIPANWQVMILDV